MEILDGAFDYNFALCRGKTIHYYEVIADNKKEAIKKAKASFERAYGSSLFRKTVVKDNVTGYTLTKMWGEWNYEW